MPWANIAGAAMFAVGAVMLDKGLFKAPCWLLIAVGMALALSMPTSEVV